MANTERMWSPWHRETDWPRSHHRRDELEDIEDMEDIDAPSGASGREPTRAPRPSEESSKEGNGTRRFGSGGRAGSAGKSGKTGSTGSGGKAGRAGKAGSGGKSGRARARARGITALAIAALGAWSCGWNESRPSEQTTSSTEASPPRVAVILMPGLSAAEADRLLRTSSLDDEPSRTPRSGAGQGAGQPPGPSKGGLQEGTEAAEIARKAEGDDPSAQETDGVSNGRAQAGRTGSGLAWARRGLWIRCLKPDETGITTVTTVDALTGRRPAVHGIWGRRFRRFDKPVHPGPSTLLADPVWVQALQRGLGLVTWDFPLAGSCMDAVKGHQCLAPAGLRTSLRGDPELQPLPQSGPPFGAQIPDRAAPVPAPPGPTAMHVWATATGPDEARVWIQGPGASLSAQRLRVGQWAQGSISWPRQGRGTAGHQRHKRPQTIRAHVWMRLLKADPNTGQTRLWVSRIRPLTLPRAWSRAFHAGESSPDADSLTAPPFPEPRLLFRGRMDRTTYAQSVLLAGPNLVTLSRMLSRRKDWNLAIISWSAFADLARGLAFHPDRPDLTAQDIPILQELLRKSRVRLDQALGRSIAVLTASGVRVLVLSPGGLEPVQVKVRIGSLIRRVAPGTRMVSQGSTALLYLPPRQRASGGADRIREALEHLDIRGSRPFGPGARILTRPRFPSSLKGGQAPDMLLQAAAGFALSGRRSRKLAVWPTEAAVDGQAPGIASRDGFAFLVGPGIEPQEIAELEAPCVAAILGQLLGLKEWPKNDGRCLQKTAIHH